MQRELELREEIIKDLELDENLLDHLITHLKLKLSENVPDSTILRLIKYDEYTKYLIQSFLDSKK
ncbi:hypothetical protein [uncultured Flavobacterium sp.]|uniref:hypothetical protein n=1 Tax=uncultured Flavobacterium sp. TaxID=165435 RepID=UPI00259596D9|nr:hypothetical protein [uncultured Flavobacterium sp.]